MTPTTLLFLFIIVYIVLVYVGDYLQGIQIEQLNKELDHHREISNTNITFLCEKLDLICENEP